jgi:hypothetical protein
MLVHTILPPTFTYHVICYMSFKPFLSSHSIKSKTKKGDLPNEFFYFIALMSPLNIPLHSLGVMSHPTQQANMTSGEFLLEFLPINKTG